ncbi:MAG: MBOAT family O-acyltransferase [Solirubrobacteraceae bacterium]|nr:MBOAT family O-acyltransferase [Solirubrobacteraceae bacterium]
MLFPAAVFLLIFLPATVAVYWTVPARMRIAVLLVASYAFYLSWNPVYGLLLASSTVANYAIARAIPDSPHPKRLLTLGIVINLSVLAFFKYAGFLSSAGADLLGWLGADTSGFDGLDILLPLAISFFTFEMISVLIDTYRRDVRVDNFLVFATYKAYFPKLVSGPITRYRELAPQLLRPAPLTFERFQSGLALFTLGLATKVALADNLAVPADRAFADPSTASAHVMAVGLGAFGLQILFDFAAYTTMARGASRMLGLELPLNFRYPYGSASPSEFWRRWHITLSRWLRDYLYIPLGGNRKGKLLTYRNLIITMILGGLWHGAGWQFAAWGALHGTFLALSHALRGRITNPSPLLRLGGALTTLSAVYFAWIFFRADSIGAALDAINTLTALPTESPRTLLLAPLAATALILASWTMPRLANHARRLAARNARLRPIAIATVTLACWITAITLSRSSLAPFVYFEF